MIILTDEAKNMLEKFFAATGKQPLRIEYHNDGG